MHIIPLVSRALVVPGTFIHGCCNLTARHPGQIFIECRFTQYEKWMVRVHLFPL